MMMMKPNHSHFLQIVLVFLSIMYFVLAISSPAHPTYLYDASALLGFKSKSDLHNNLNYSLKSIHSFCKWEGVQCSNSRAIKLTLNNKNLAGIFAPNTLTKLAQLRLLSLQNNSLTSPIPDLSGLLNLKVLFLSKNYFSASIPHSIPSLHRLKTLDLSYNMLSGSILDTFNRLDRLYYLRLDFNRFNGSVLSLNLSSLLIFNVSPYSIMAPPTHLVWVSIHTLSLDATGQLLSPAHLVWVPNNARPGALDACLPIRGELVSSRQGAVACLPSFGWRCP